MSLFLDIISVVGTAVSIAGVSLKDLMRKPLPPGDKDEIKKFLRFLEAREVLFTGMDDEVHSAVIRSLEQIKLEIEGLRQRCHEDLVHTVLLNLLLVMSKKLQKLHGIDSASPHGKYLMYLALQSSRFELARTLALLCAAFDIEPQNPRMKKFVLNFAVRPR